MKFNEFLHNCMNKLNIREEVHIIKAEGSKMALEKFIADNEAKSAPEAAGAGAGLLGKLGGGGGGPNPMHMLKLRMEFTLKQKVEDEMKELEHRKTFRTRIMKMKENENDGFSYENLDNCREILQPYFVGKKTLPKPFFIKK